MKWQQLQKNIKLKELKELEQYEGQVKSRKLAETGTGTGNVDCITDSAAGIMYSYVRLVARSAYLSN